MGKKAPTLESLFNNVAGPEAYDFVKERDSSTVVFL